MRLAKNDCTPIRNRLGPRRVSFPTDFHLPQRPSSSSKTASSKPQPSPESLYDAWLKSRELPHQKGTYLVPGAPRALTVQNFRLAMFACQMCVFDLFKTLWGLHPLRTTAMVTLNILRSLFPAFRGYSQALIIDEFQALIGSESFTWSRLLYLICTEILRRVVEGWLDTLLTTNENIVLGSARFYIEYKQMEHRVRLDVPTLADPQVRDLLQESDLFARSFSGGGFGFISPLDFLNIFSLIIEILSHLWLLFSFTRDFSQFGVLVFTLISATFPFVLSRFSNPSGCIDNPITAKEARAADKQERMRNLAYSEQHRPEIALFGLGDWILSSWSAARKIVLSSEQPVTRNSTAHFADIIYALQNLPVLLLLQSSATTLGAITAYRTSIQCTLYAFGNLITTTKMAFQGIFLMSAFCASVKLRPRLMPKHEDLARYMPSPSGAKIDVKNLSFTYPGCTEPALRNINFSIQPGETLAIVGYNGSGKSTLARILLRIVDFEKGSLHVNGVDVRCYSPAEYHSHLSAVFQGFSKFNSTVKENVGLGNVDKIRYKPAIETAIHLAEADTLVESLPNGLKTQLESPGFESVSYPGSMGSYDMSPQRHGLSGGEWQRIALARAFMRANEPEVELLIFDEPTSSLDAHAQNQIFDTIAKISKTPSGDKRKSVIFITHRLSTARRADKVAMMENGTISEFGTHDELIANNGSYAALYRASI
ncbi:P-loop containing nucleoside triphosphate hydrolase protein [Coprinopsis marcescibilis]|uniref:P-loop containing nucleoside triphosphate hydrolase protein n=1 Tax=Coprinopsis marcescibilis TaxID=230819 RepID=A0A5C3L881_COPMA|nr:P-loop containing nucleoside triphosphate hydrolase protein [Coprinopsis marcescibilis]